MHDFNIAESFGELKPNAFLRCIAYMTTVPTNEITMKALLSLFGFFDAETRKQRQFITSIFNEIINSDYVESLIPLLDFLKKSELKFKEWLVPSVKIGKTEYFGTNDSFSEMTFGEFISADMLISAFFGSKNMKALDSMISIIFREKKNGKKIPMNSDDYKMRIPIIAELDELTKTAIYYNYIAVRATLTEKYPAVFSEPEQKRNQIELGKKNSGWLEIRRQLAGEVLKLREIDDLSLHEALAFLNSKILENG